MKKPMLKRSLAFLAALALLAVAGCAPASSSQPASSAAVPASSAAPASSAEPPAAPTDLETDVLIIGAGGAGLAAAVSATEAGASVIVVEKLGMTGGNTMISGGAFNSSDPEGQKSISMTDSLTEIVTAALTATPINDDHKLLIADVQKKYDEYLASGSTSLFDCPEWHALQTFNDGDHVGNIELIRMLTNSTLPTKQWLTTFGVEWQPQIAQVVGAMWQRSAQPTTTQGLAYTQPLQKRAEADGAKVLTDTKAETLILENGRVCGANVVDSKGNTYAIRASKGVIMATGGFSANVEMRQKYNTVWPDLGENIGTTNMSGATGDGIVMGEAVNAALIDMNLIQLMPLNLKGTTSGVTGYVNSAMFINDVGERFVREDGRRDVLAAAALKQTKGEFWLICDKSSAPDGLSQYLQPLAEIHAQGKLPMADTLEELAEQINIPADVLIASVEKFNAAVEAGVADEFGRELWDQKIDTAPFYASQFGPAVHHTMGGLKVDVETHVLDNNGNIIPGFYAAGEVTGGIHGANRIGGNAVPDALAFGKIAGANAAAEK